VITSNAAALIARMRARKEHVTRELTAEARPMAREINTEARKIMVAEIYSVPIPFKASALRRVEARGAIHPARTRSGGIMRPLSPKMLAKLSAVAIRGQYGQWTRTNRLLAREKADARGVLITLHNNMVYAHARHVLGTPQGRRIRSKGVRSVQWQWQAVANKQRYILERRRAAVLRALVA
jgi:hypothetical protein